MNQQSKPPCKSFAEKYGLVGKGMPVCVSQATKDYVRMLCKRSETIIEMGEFYAKHDKTKYR
jgi:hypothetical protein